MSSRSFFEAHTTFKTSILVLVLFQILLAQAQESEYSLDYDDYILFHWKGATTSHSITLKVFPRLTELNSTDYNTYICVYTKSDSGDVEVTSLNPVDFKQSQYPVEEVILGGLSNNTQYFYSFVFMKSGSVDSGQFKTIIQQGIPTEFNFTTFGLALTPYSFTFGAASCASTGSERPIFTTLKDQNFDFFVHMGDLHYSDIAENNVEKFYGAYYKVFNSATQKAFFQSTPFFYVWDDHDFGAGNAISSSPSNPAVNSAYRDFVPHGSLKNDLPSDDNSVFPETAPQSANGNYLSDSTPQNDIGVFQSFIVGRCLFIVMDLRSYKDGKEDDILGDEQTTWLENQLRYAGYNDGIVQVFMVSSFPWIHEGKPTEWSPYTKVQSNIADLINRYIYKNNKNIMMLSGDSHMIAFDDGSSNPYGDFPVVQAAAMDRYGSCKGGPYSHNYETGPDHYGSLNVVDNGSDSVCIKISLKEKEEIKIAYDTCNPDKYPSNLSFCPVATPSTTTSDNEDGSFSLTIIISIGIILTGLISWIVYNKSRKEQQRQAETSTPEVHQYVEMREPFNRRSNNE